MEFVFEQHIKALLAGQATTINLLNQLVKGQSDMAATLKDIQTKMAALQASVAANTTVDTSILTLIQGFKAQLTDLSTQLQAAIANGNDPVAIQAVADGMDSLNTALEANTTGLQAAVTANTPAPAA
jgi:FlaG/FlaF family flagellin (archaellin)